MHYFLQSTIRLQKRFLARGPWHRQHSESYGRPGDRRPAGISGRGYRRQGPHPPGSARSAQNHSAPQVAPTLPQPVCSRSLYMYRLWSHHWSPQRAVGFCTWLEKRSITNVTRWWYFSCTDAHRAVYDSSMEPSLAYPPHEQLCTCQTVIRNTIKHGRCIVHILP